VQPVALYQHQEIVMTTPRQDPSKGSRKPAKSDLGRTQGHKTSDDHPENQQGAAKATQDNDLTTGHSEEGDGGDDNSKQKSQ
jgi:hypothetical protein